MGAAFALNLGFSAVPTPLYVIYQSRDHFSTLMITVVYAIYAASPSPQAPELSCAASARWPPPDGRQPPQVGRYM